MVACLLFLDFLEWVAHKRLYEAVYNNSRCPFLPIPRRLQQAIIHSTHPPLIIALLVVRVPRFQVPVQSRWRLKLSLTGSNLVHLLHHHRDPLSTEISHNAHFSSSGKTRISSGKTRISSSSSSRNRTAGVSVLKNSAVRCRMFQKIRMLVEKGEAVTLAASELVWGSSSLHRNSSRRMSSSSRCASSVCVCVRVCVHECACVRVCVCAHTFVLGRAAAECEAACQWSDPVGARHPARRCRAPTGSDH